MQFDAARHVPFHHRGIGTDRSDRNIIEAQFNALENRAGQLLTKAAFSSIPTLIPPDQISQIETSLRQAAAEVRERQLAKQVLDGVVQTVIIAARLAAKVV